MAKITEESRKEFQQEANRYKERIAELLEKEKNVLELVKMGGADIEYKKLLLAT